MTTTATATASQLTALHALLRADPCAWDELPAITGWGIAITRAALRELHERGHITWRHHGGRRIVTAAPQCTSGHRQPKTPPTGTA